MSLLLTLDRSFPLAALNAVANNYEEVHLSMVNTVDGCFINTVDDCFT